MSKGYIKKNCFVISHFPMPITNIEHMFLMSTYWELGGEHIENMMWTYWELVDNTFETSKSQKVQTHSPFPKVQKKWASWVHVALHHLIGPIKISIHIFVGHWFFCIRLITPLSMSLGTYFILRICTIIACWSSNTIIV